MATPSTDSHDAPSGPSLTAFFAAGGGVLASRPLLALVPLLATFTSVENVERTAAAENTFQVVFGLPTPVAGLWTFVNAPTPDGVTVFGYPRAAVLADPGLLLPAVGVGALGALLVGLAAAVYLGAIDDHLAGRPSDHAGNLRRYAPVTLALPVLQLVGVLLLVPVGLFAPSPAVLVPVILLAIPVLFVLAPGPYVGVATDAGVREAFARGVDLALTGDYLLFALAHVIVAALASLAVSAVAFTGGLAGVAVAAVVAAPLGLALNAATMAFVRDRIGGGRRPGGETDGPTPAVRRVVDDG